MKNKIILVVVILIVSVCDLSSKDKILLDRVVANVNKTAITLSELYKRFENLKKINPEIKEKTSSEDGKKKVLNDILDKMIVEVLISDELTKNRRSVSEKEIDGAIDNVKKQNDMTEEELSRALSEEGKSLLEYRIDLKRQLEYFKLINTEIRPNIPVSYKDIEEYYKTNYSKKNPDKRATLRIIFIKMSETPLSDDLLLKIRDEFIKNESLDITLTFPELTNDSQVFDTESLPIADIDEDLKESVKKLKENEISEPVKSSKGYYIIKLKKIDEDKAKPLAEVTEEIKEELTRKKIDIEFEKWKEKVKKRSYIEKKLY